MCAKCESMIFLSSALVLIALCMSGCQYNRKLATITNEEDAPVVIDSDCGIHPDKLVAPDYLFDFAITNAYQCNLYPNPWIERARGWVDLNNDGVDDLILSEPFSSGGTGGLGFQVFFATNGLYRAVGSIGGHLSTIRVEKREYLGCVIWSYSHCNCCTGSFCWLEIDESGYTQSGRVAVYIPDGEDSFGHDLDKIIRKWATVPIRWEVSHTENGIVSWRPKSLR